MSRPVPPLRCLNSSRITRFARLRRTAPPSFRVAIIPSRFRSRPLGRANKVRWRPRIRVPRCCTARNSGRRRMRSPRVRVRSTIPCGPGSRMPATRRKPTTRTGARAPSRGGASGSGVRSACSSACGSRVSACAGGCSAGKCASSCPVSGKPPAGGAAREGFLVRRETMMVAAAERPCQRRPGRRRSRPLGRTRTPVRWFAGANTYPITMVRRGDEPSRRSFGAHGDCGRSISPQSLRRARTPARWLAWRSIPAGRLGE